MAYDITAINPHLPLPKDPSQFTISRFTLNNRGWRLVVGALVTICGHLTTNDREMLTRYEGRILTGEKAELAVVHLRRALLHRNRHQTLLIDGEEVAVTDWLWEALEMVYEMLCWSDGFTVR